MVLIQQVGVDLARGGGGGVAQGLADVEQGRALGGGHGGEGVAQAVEGDFGQVVGLNEAGEGQGYGVGGVGVALGVHRHHAGVRPGVSQGQLALGLPGAFPPQQAVEIVAHVEDAVGGAVLGLLLHDLRPGGGAGLLDVELAQLEVHAAPPQAADLLPTQAQAARQLDDQLQPVALHQAEQPLELRRGVESGLMGDDPGRLHPLCGTAENDVLPERHVQGAGEQIVVPPYRIGRQALVPHEHGVVLLEMLGRQLLDGDGAQRVGQVVVDDLAVAVDGGGGSVGLNDLLHPVFQPLIQGHGAGGHGLVGVLFRLKIAQAPAGLGQRGVGLVLLHSLAGFIQAVIHADIVFLSHFVKRYISFYFFSSHRFKIPHFSTELDFYSIIRNCERP